MTVFFKFVPRSQHLAVFVLEVLVGREEIAWQRGYYLYCSYNGYGGDGFEATPDVCAAQFYRTREEALADYAARGTPVDVVVQVLEFRMAP